MILPVKVGDTLTSENCGLPWVVTRAHVIKPMSEEQRDISKWLGYTLGRYEEPCLYIEYKIFRHSGSIRVHMKPDSEGRLVTMADPGSWAGGRYVITRRNKPVYIQSELFQDSEALA